VPPAARRSPLSAPPKAGRSITIGHHEARLAAARLRQTDPAWKADYRATRPKVERKIAHLMRSRHGGRRARMRGRARVAADFNLLAAALNHGGRPGDPPPENEAGGGSGGGDRTPARGEVQRRRRTPEPACLVHLVLDRVPDVVDGHRPVRHRSLVE
jgi:hypothetical protein